jgi:hypothetical protein
MNLMTSKQAREYLRGGEGRMVKRTDWTESITRTNGDRYITFSGGAVSHVLGNDINENTNDWYPCDSTGNPIEPETAAPPAPTWQTETCGTCGWLLVGDSNYCRNSTWGTLHTEINGNQRSYYALGRVGKDTPACPAYVPRS